MTFWQTLSAAYVGANIAFIPAWAFFRAKQKRAHKQQIVGMVHNDVGSTRVRTRNNLSNVVVPFRSNSL